MKSSSLILQTCTATVIVYNKPTDIETISKCHNERDIHNTENGLNVLIFF